MSNQQDQSRKAQIQNLAQLCEVAFFIGLLYVFYLAPMNVLRGRINRRLDALAGVVGLAFWASAIAILVGGVSP